MLTAEQVRDYRRLRKIGAIGVLWADAGSLYFAEKPDGSGFYRRDQARFMGDAEFLAHMRLARGKLFLKTA